MTCHAFEGNGIKTIVCTYPWGRLHVGNRYIWIDFHPYCGPSFSYMNGNAYEPEDENDPVWPEFEKWFQRYQARKARHDIA